MPAADAFSAARNVITAGLDARAFPAAVIDVGRESGPLWREAFGTLTYAADARPCRLDTIFDLASLTKVLATASIAMTLVDQRRLEVERPVGDILPEWRDEGRSAIQIRHLLDHSSGLPAHARLWEETNGAGFREAIRALPLAGPPGVRSVYSDPGFMLLGFALEDAGGGPLDELFGRLGLGGDEPLLYRPWPDLAARTAPTENDPWRGRVLQGEVHDENAAALGGVAPHAGLFGTAGAVATVARLVLRTFRERTPLGPPALMRTFATKTGVPRSSRALAWDTMLPTSSCGTRLSPSSIGHTGFTGTSLWIDHERDLYVVFLTNRVHPTRTNEQLPALRPRVHDAVVEGLS
jgi:CubicO group peptidase (beta-lactamase class C family)